MTIKEAIDKLLLGPLLNNLFLESVRANNLDYEAFFTILESVQPGLGNIEALKKRRAELLKVEKIKEPDQVEKEIYKLLEPLIKEKEKVSGRYLEKITFSRPENDLLEKLNPGYRNTVQWFKLWIWGDNVYVIQNDIYDKWIGSYSEEFRKKVLEIIKSWP